MIKMVFVIPNNSTAVLVIFQFSRLIWFLEVFHSSSLSFKVEYSYSVFLCKRSIYCLLPAGGNCKFSSLQEVCLCAHCVPVPFGAIPLVQFWSSAGKLLSEFCEIII